MIWKASFQMNFFLKTLKFLTESNRFIELGFEINDFVSKLFCLEIRFAAWDAEASKVMLKWNSLTLTLVHDSSNKSSNLRNSSNSLLLESF